MAKFILFDIDHTLIDSGGSGIIALNRSLEELHGIPDGFKNIRCAGKTDLQILSEAFILHGLHGHDGMIERFRRRYLEYLREAMARGKGRVKPGVPELLQRLARMESCRLGLLTGNLEEGARIKLEPFELNPFFPVGAFGSDHADRNRLLPIAVERLTEREGRRIAYSDCVVIGDTPLDVECAKIHGALAVAVATGPYSVEALRETDADLVFEDLTDAGRIMSWLEGLRPAGSQN